MQMEVDFFASQPFKFPPRPIKLLVIDFDDTCTAQDTSALIAETAIEASAKASEDPEASRSKGQQMLEELVFNYVSKRDGLLDEILPDVPWNEGEEGSEEFDMTWLGDFLDRLSDFDREMNSVVVESGILAGIKRGTMSDVGARVAMRPGCLKFLHHAVHTGIPTAIVSVNWSAELVAAALQQHSSASSQESEYHLPGGAVKLISGGFETDIPTPGTVHVYANDLEYFGESSTGGIRRRCECAVDKGRLFEDLLLGVAVAEVKPEVETETVENVRGSSVPRGLSVYIGDSMTDLSALISADVGIILGSNRHIRHVAAVAGLQIRPLVTYPMDVESAAAHFDSETHPVIYEASSWSEVYAFVFGRQRERAPQSPEQKDRPSVPTTPADQEDHPGKWCTMSVPNPVRLLSIAGSDSGGGAGIQADIKTSSALGAYSTTAITAITAQNSHGVANIFSTPIDILRAQIRAVLSDIGADAIKTGMLPSTQAVEAVADELSGFSMHERPHIVVDPVLMATSGDALAEPGVAQAVLQHLFPLATVVTPNIDEARMLLSAAGLASDQYLSLIADLQGVRAAAREIHALGPKWVLIKGGHLDAPHEQGPIWYNKDDTTVVNLCPLPHCNASAPRMVVDVLFDGTRYYEFWAPFIDTANTHGTGCTLATAIAIKLAEGVGLNVPEAVQAAKKYVWETLLASSGLTIGSGPNQAMLHAYQRNGVRAPMLRQNPLDLRMYVITDELLIEKNCGGLTLEEAVHAAIRGGATIVQIREKELGGGEFLKRAARVLDVCREHGVPLIVNDRVDIALVIGADGVHVGQEDMGVEAVRRLMGDGAIIGVSAKTVEQARAAEKGGADYIGAGAIFPTGTKSDSSVIGLDGLRAVCRAVSIPVVAVGGLNASTVKRALTEGEANGVAVVSAAFGSPDVQSAAAALRKIVNTVLDESKLKSEPKSPAP